MTSRGVHIECPTCRGLLGVAQWARVTTCDYCDTPLLVEVEGVLPWYSIAPTIDKDAARRSLQQALRHPDVPAGFLAQSSLRSCELYFVPFHELQAKRVGTLTQRHEPGRSPAVQESNPFSGLPSPHSRRPVSAKPTVDTRVVLSDVSLAAPATELVDWGLVGISLSKARAEHQVALLPYDSRATAALGRTLAPRLDPRKLIPDASEQRRLSGDATTYESIRLKVVYYPVWRLRYLHHGRLYSASVDGVTGSCLSLRAPQSASSRVGWLLASALSVGLVVGVLLRIFFGVFGSSGGNLLAGLLLTLVGLGTWALLPAIVVGLVLLLVAELGYEQFRYPGEVIIEGGRSHIVKLGKLRPLLADKLSAALEKWVKRQEERP